MALTSLPEVGDDLGPVKEDAAGITTGLTTFIYGAEWNVAAAALEDVCAQVGLADGSTAGSIQERVDALPAAISAAAIALTWAGAINVDTVTHTWAGYQRIGDLVRLSMEFTVTPLASGLCAVTLDSLGDAPAYSTGQTVARVTALGGSEPVVAGADRDGVTGQIQVVVMAAAVEAYRVNVAIDYETA